LGNDKLTASQHREVQIILEELGSRDYVTNMAKQEVEKALRILKEFETLPGYDFLCGLLNYILERES
jgi:geranylgeranyl pyrophosphate synthase